MEQGEFGRGAGRAGVCDANSQLQYIRLINSSRSSVGKVPSLSTQSLPQRVQVGTTLTSVEGTHVARREVLWGALTAGFLPALPAEAKTFQEGLNRYIRKKPLEDIYLYLPPTLLARAQIANCEAYFTPAGLSSDDVEAARGLLRDGQAKQLRENLRTLRRYIRERSEAEEPTVTPEGNEAAKQGLVDFIDSLEELDNELFLAKRDGEGIPGEKVPELLETLGIILASIDTILEQLPQKYIERAQAVAQANNSVAFVPDPSLSDTKEPVSIVKRLKDDDALF
ncbi:hypothetical protein CYMTET_26881 [Cymbomonas tetramitiformis]|uniref:DUF7880 domain-containing protein n=1 Tax=Cymbomonas tetramitiformis TaxID=36881 RepID=A0AAE0KXJ9_9CHLO|nr:hypothetical protein CYMTET_26881 [Cymbomonas tetramitiformis]